MPAGQSFDGLSGKVLSNPVPANDASGALTLATPRTDTVTLPSTPTPSFDASVTRSRTPIQSDMVAAAAALLERLGVPLPYRWTELTTTEAATAELDERFEALRDRGPAVPVTPKFTG
ncbi:MAG TPA: hypothetical protein VFW06_10250 [Acidimicrobiia bacterium]|nr:hypothetical protein [Acidimicrobiia bacterium]